MRIYVDFDDCLCETGRAFSKLVLEMFNKNVPYDQIFIRFWCLIDPGTENVFFRIATIIDAPIGGAFARLFQVYERSAGKIFADEYI